MKSWIIIIATVVLVVGGWWGYRELRIDRCLDAGGSWNAAGNCCNL